MHTWAMPISISTKNILTYKKDKKDNTHFTVAQNTNFCFNGSSRWEARSQLYWYYVVDVNFTSLLILLEKIFI